MMAAHEAAPRMRAEAQKALDLDPSLSEAHAMLAAVAATYDYDWPEVDRRFRLALASGSVSPLVRDWYAQVVFAIEGRSAQALEQSEQALREDPLNPMFHCTRSLHLNAVGRYQEGEAELRRALELNPNLMFAYYYTFGQYLSRGMEEQELASAEKVHSIAPRNPIAIGYLAGMLARTGNTAFSHQLLRQLESGLEYAQPFGLALYYALISNVESAADWMERAIEQRVPQVAFHRRAPIFAPLRASPRWPALARLMNLKAANE
jgi:serine/threonine-protein kinase